MRRWLDRLGALLGGRRIGDREYAERLGRSPGGDIFIHGQPNALPVGRLPGDWTDGCIALSNREIEELWRLVPDGTPIEIRT